MKKLTLLLLIPFYSISQDYTHSCPEGHKWLPSIATTSFRIEGDTCVLDSVWEDVLKQFRKNLCYETGMSMGEMCIDKKCRNEWNYWYERKNEWIDSVGCISKELYYKIRKGKTKFISKEEYDKHSVVKTESF